MRRLIGIIYDDVLVISIFFYILMVVEIKKLFVWGVSF